MRKLSLRDVKLLFKVIHLVGGRAGTDTQNILFNSVKGWMDGWVGGLRVGRQVDG